ncbi:type II toxin-antitoxin system VapC family toxin [Terracidiphilus sp.]|uniref:type II toxin-antitoxin system VapC family toxin n=1 Tax=Terracidiphilus sp. TaxID=1964191 RepID=UPI003C1658FA
MKKEPGWQKYFDVIEAAEYMRFSAASYLETSIVMDKEPDAITRAGLDDLIAYSEIIIEPVTAEQAKIARQAYRNFGKGSGHRAGLNFGDCFSYALAKVTREPILFKGNDFQHTDLRAAV